MKPVARLRDCPGPARELGDLQLRPDLDVAAKLAPELRGEVEKVA